MRTSKHNRNVKGIIHTTTITGEEAKGAFGSEDMIQGMRISLTRWLGIANFSVWLRGFDVVRIANFLFG
jgi:hypothetical protein